MRAKKRVLVAALAVLSLVGGNLSAAPIISADSSGEGILYNGATGSFTTTYSNGGAAPNGYDGLGYRFNGISGREAVWSFTNLPSVNYTVHTFYNSGATADNVLFYVYDGSNLRDSGNIDQTAVPNDLTYDDGQGSHT